MAIGYACKTIGVANTQISLSTIKNATNERLNNIIRINLDALENMIDYNIANNILLYRISSDIIPFATHPVNQIKWWEAYQDDFTRIGKRIRSSGMRVSMHPGQYTVLNSNQEMVYLNAVKELEYHDQFLSALRTDEQSKIILHIGGAYGDKKKAMQVFIDRYHNLNSSIKSRLVIENDDKIYNISEVLEIARETKAPVVFDFLHHEVNQPEEHKTSYEWLMECSKTWSEKDGKQKVHFSLQKEGGLSGAHSDTILIRPFFDFYEKLPKQNIDIMLEVKDKNLSAIKCINLTSFPTNRNRLNKEWFRYQYFIRSRSESLYQELVEHVVNEDAVDMIKFYDYVEKAFTLPVSLEAEVKTANIVWDEIESICTETEKKRFDKFLTAYRNGTGTLKPLKNHILKCALANGREYLQDSLYFYL